MWLIFCVAKLNNLYLVLLEYQLGDFEWLQKSDFFPKSCAIESSLGLCDESVALK